MYWYMVYTHTGIVASNLISFAVYEHENSRKFSCLRYFANPRYVYCTTVTNEPVLTATISNYYKYSANTVYIFFLFNTFFNLLQSQ